MPNPIPARYQAATVHAGGRCPIEAGLLGRLADHECAHGRLPADPSTKCGCWPQETAAVTPPQPPTHPPAPGAARRVRRLPMRESTHRCPVGDCPARVPHDQLMCPRHWRLMPGSLKRALYRAWQDGAGAGGHEHQQGIRACIDAVSPHPAPDEQPPDRVRRFLAAYRHPNAINGETWDEEDVSRAIRAIRCHPHQPDPRTRRCRRCGAIASS